MQESPAFNLSSTARRNAWVIVAPIAVLAVVSLLIGIVTVADYGQSTDEQWNIELAQGSLQSYQHRDEPYRDPSREDKGPFYLMVWVVVGEFLGRVVPGWAFADGRHIMNFVMFQVAVISVYVLSLRFVRPGTALLAAVLFETQPLLYGHAFINQKDIPFMALFAATVAVGLALTDKAARIADVPQPVRHALTPSWQEVRRSWHQMPLRKRRLTGAVAGLLLILALVMRGPVLTIVETVVRAAYQGETWEPIHQLFVRLATHMNEVPVEAYVRRAQELTTVALVGIWIVAMLVMTVVTLTWLFPAIRRGAWATVVREVRQGCRLSTVLSILPAAIVLGMAIAVRSSALFAGLLVALYAIARMRLRGVPLLVVHSVVAGCVAYALWPQLWGSAIDVVKTSLEWPVKNLGVHQVLFEGVTYVSTALPRRYLPELLAIQLTLPAVLLILAGFGVALCVMRSRGPAGRVIPLLLAWFFVPVLAVVILRIPLYNYFRHLLFILPAAFVLAALPMEKVRQLVRPRLAQAVLAVGIVLPGMVAMVRLHPYEYGYFNELVGGVRGAYGRYVPDYWCTSLREAMEFVNEHALPSAEIAVVGSSIEDDLVGPEDNAIPFAREDLVVRDGSMMQADSSFQPTYILACNLATVAPDSFPDAPVVWVVQRDGVPLTIVKLNTETQPGDR